MRGHTWSYVSHRVGPARQAVRVMMFVRICLRPLLLSWSPHLLSPLSRQELSKHTPSCKYALHPAIYPALPERVSPSTGSVFLSILFYTQCESGVLMQSSWGGCKVPKGVVASPGWHAYGEQTRRFLPARLPLSFVRWMHGVCMSYVVRRTS